MNPVGTAAGASGNGQRVVRVVGMGDAGVDLVLRVDRLPSPDEKVMARSVHRLPGGMIGNFVSCLSRLGTPCGFLGCLGDDDFGRICREAMAAHGVDLSRLTVKPDQTTYCSVSLVDARGEKALVIAPAETIFPEPSDLGAGQFEGIELLHTTGLNGATTLEAIRLSREAGVRISLDLEPSAIEANGPVLDEILAATEILFVNRNALGMLFSADLSPEECGARLLERGPRLVVATRGEQGATVITESECFVSGAYSVPVVDTTGAGDCFAAAFLHACLRNRPLVEAARFANAAAAISVGQVGAQSAPPTEEDVYRRFNLIQARS